MTKHSELNELEQLLATVQESFLVHLHWLLGQTSSGLTILDCPAVLCQRLLNEPCFCSPLGRVRELEHLLRCCKTFIFHESVHLQVYVGFDDINQLPKALLKIDTLVAVAQHTGGCKGPHPVHQVIQLERVHICSVLADDGTKAPFQLNVLQELFQLFPFLGLESRMPVLALVSPCHGLRGVVLVRKRTCKGCLSIKISRRLAFGNRQSAVSK
mmetsp:Transcript_96795/g.224362  ORF Transcript_96795/g.224362 Transcript_96795/m.224362 type:complete len:213 (-) Transcript_96795:29-667(-)